MGIEKRDEGVKTDKENSDVDMDLKKRINIVKEQGKKHLNKDSEIINGNHTTKNPENGINSYVEPKFCPKCGVSIQRNYKFCKNCGHQLLAFKQANIKSENHDKDILVDGQVGLALGDNEDVSLGDQVGLALGDNEDVSLGDQVGLALEDSKDVSLGEEVEVVLRDNKDSHNESKTKDLPKVFKIPSPNKNNNESEKSTIEMTKLRNQENKNLNIDENIKKENKININDLNEDINEKNTISYSVADEIYKFYKLKEKGIVTPEEFEKKKKQLLEQ